MPVEHYEIILSFIVIFSLIGLILGLIVSSFKEDVDHFEEWCCDEDLCGCVKEEIPTLDSEWIMRDLTSK